MKKNYQLFDTLQHGWMWDEVVCNGCGVKLQSCEERQHLQTCLISNIRRNLDKKSNGKLTFTKVR